MASAASLSAFTDFLEDQSDEDNESLASLETDDGQIHAPEKILAQFPVKIPSPSEVLAGVPSLIWYLVKWQDCPTLRSSWELRELFILYPEVLDSWQAELQKQAEGKSVPFDIHAFDKAVAEAEEAERQRRILRRLKRKLNRILSIVTH